MSFQLLDQLFDHHVNSTLFFINATSYSMPDSNIIKLWPNKILVLVYTMVFAIGLVGNITVIYFVLFYKRMQSMTNKFITNLALADLLVIFICIPDEITRLLEIQWKFKEYFCKITNFSQGISLCVSIMTLTAISIDRYYIIYKPVKARSIYTHKKVRIIVIFIWIFSIAIMSPILFISKYEKIPLPKGLGKFSYALNNFEFNDLNICYEDWIHMEIKLVYGIFLTCILFIFPIAFMSYAYYSISKTLWFSADKETEKSLKQTLVQAIQILSLTGNKDMRGFNMNSKRVINENHIQSSDGGQKKSSGGIYNEQLSVNVNINKNGFYPEGRNSNVEKELAYALIESSSIDHHMLELQRSPIRINSFNSRSIHNSTERVASLSKKIQQRKDSDYQIKKVTIKMPSICNSTAVVSHPRTHSVYSRSLNQGSVNPLFGSLLNKNEQAYNKLIRSRQRVVKLLIILLLLFIISWLPFHINGILIDLAAIWEAGGQQKVKGFYSDTLIEQLFPISLCLALANSATNPVCFIALSQSFREKFKASCCFCNKRSKKLK